MRLVRGKSENEGQIQFCVDCQWGVVCEDSWDINDAIVVCRDLGYNVEGKYCLRLNVYKIKCNNESLLCTLYQFNRWNGKYHSTSLQALRAH